MEILVQLEDGDAARVGTMAALLDWLRRDPSVARAAERIEAPTSEDPHSLGDTFEVINVIATHIEALSAVAISLASWLQGRQQAPPVQIKLEQRCTVLRNGSEEEVRTAIEHLTAFPSDASDGDTDDGAP